MEDGTYNAVINGVRIVDNRFGQEGKEIEFKVGLFDASGNPLAETEVYLEYSNRYGMGNMSQLKQWQICETELKRLGFQGGSDFTRLGELVNTRCRVNYKTKDKDGKPYATPRAYFAFTVVRAVEGDVNAIMAAIRNTGGSTFAAPAPAPAPAAGVFGNTVASPFNFPQPGAAPAPAPASFAGGFGSAPGFPA